MVKIALNQLIIKDAVVGIFQAVTIHTNILHHAIARKQSVSVIVIHKHRIGIFIDCAR